MCSITKGTFRNMLWTGRAIRVCRTPVIMNARELLGVSIPAMPDDLFALLAPLKLLFKHNNNIDKFKHRYEKCLATTLDVRNVPMKPESTKVASQVHKDALDNRHDSLKNFHPCEIVTHNIGANRGLLFILRKHYEDRMQHTDQCDMYSAFNVDIDIFTRMMKVHFILLMQLVNGFC